MSFNRIKAASKASYVQPHIPTGRKDCPHCGKVLKDTTALRNHVKIHTGTQNYTCETCGKKMSTAIAYERHMGVHEKKFECDQCGGKYSSSSVLNLHIKREHSAHKPEDLICSHCAKKFGKVQSCRDHQKECRKAPNFKPYYCPVKGCKYAKKDQEDVSKDGFARLKDYNAHLKKEHK